MKKRDEKTTQTRKFSGEVGKTIGQADTNNKNELSFTKDMHQKRIPYRKSRLIKEPTTVTLRTKEGEPVTIQGTRIRREYYGKDFFEKEK